MPVSLKTIQKHLTATENAKQAFTDLYQILEGRKISKADNTKLNKLYLDGRKSQKLLQDSIFKYKNEDKKKNPEIEKLIDKPLAYFVSYKENKNSISELSAEQKYDRIMNPIMIPIKMTDDPPIEAVMKDADLDGDDKINIKEVLSQLKRDIGAKRFDKNKEIIDKEIADLQQENTFDEEGILNPKFKNTFYEGFKETIKRKISKDKKVAEEVVKPSIKKVEEPPNPEDTKVAKNNQQQLDTEVARNIAELQKQKQDEFDNSQEERKKEIEEEDVGDNYQDDFDIDLKDVDDYFEIKDVDEKGNEIPTEKDKVIQEGLDFIEQQQAVEGGLDFIQQQQEQTERETRENRERERMMEEEEQTRDFNRNPNPQPNPPVETPERPDPALQFVGKREPIIEGERQEFLDVEGSGKGVNLDNQISNLLKQQNEQRQNKTIDVLKQEIRAYHLVYDDNIDEFRTNPHIGQKNDALKSSDIDVVRRHHKNMEETIAKFYNRGNLRLGIVIDAEEYLRRISLTKTDLVKDGMMETSKTRGGRDVFSKAKSIKSQFIRGGLEHARSKPVLNRLPQTIEPKYKESFLQNPPQMSDTPFKYTINNRRPMLPDYIKF